MATRIRRGAYLIPLSVLLVLYLFGGPPVYFAKATRGTVVDAETQQPIPGAVVVAQWILYEGILGLGHHGTRIKVAETVTDASGGYEIPWWGPRLRLPFARLDYRDPELLVFKHGYEPKRLLNDLERPFRVVRFSEWDEKKLGLKPFDGAVKIRLDQLYSALTGCDDAGVPLPKLYNEMLIEQPSLGAQGKNFFISAKHLKERKE